MVLDHEKKIIKCFLLTSLVVSTYLYSFNITNAASLNISPGSINVNEGDIVSAKVFIDSENKSINNADGDISFPSDLLSVVSIDNSSSIFTLWIQNPTFSNTDGKIEFNGGLLSPGYLGNNGGIFTIKFKAKKSGSASMVFTDGAVRANDGLGTDLLSSKNGSTINISAGNRNDSTPVRPIIVSDTNPNQDIWSTSRTATFGWKIPNNVTSIQASLSSSPSEVPTNLYDNSVSQKTINNIADGKSYFHIRFANENGYGPTANYRILIDGTAPSSFKPVISSDGYKDIITLNAKDSVSGIDYYLIKIDSLPPIKVDKKSISNGKYELPVLSQNKHNLVASAYDVAGNHTDANLNFVSPEIIPPKLQIDSKEIKQGDTLKINGETQYPNQDVEVFTQLGNSTPVSYKVRTSDQGSFTMVTNPIKKEGSLVVWSQISFSDTVKSNQSENISVKVRNIYLGELFSIIESDIITTLPMLLLLIPILFVLCVCINKLVKRRKRLNKKIEATLDDVHDMMSSLKKKLNKQLEELEYLKVDRKLNKKEQEIFKKLEKKVDDIEELIEKKIKKLSK